MPYSCCAAHRLNAAAEWVTDDKIERNVLSTANIRMVGDVFSPHFLVLRHLFPNFTVDYEKLCYAAYRIQLPLVYVALADAVLRRQVHCRTVARPRHL